MSRICNFYGKKICGIFTSEFNFEEILMFYLSRHVFCANVNRDSHNLQNSRKKSSQICYLNNEWWRRCWNVNTEIGYFIKKLKNKTACATALPWEFIKGYYTWPEANVFRMNCVRFRRKLNFFFLSFVCIQLWIYKEKSTSTSMVM